MCGIAGYLLHRPATAPHSFFEALLAPLRSRGPEDEGACLALRASGSFTSFRLDRTVSRMHGAMPHLGSEAGRQAHDLALFHTRFRVMDPSPEAHQPFVSHDRTVVGVLNGSIYNHVELREELRQRGVPLRTTSDTEVLVEAWRVWGDSVWAKLNGSWAAALYDVRRGALSLSRDRFGIAPLYLRETTQGLFFSSLITPLREVVAEGTRVHEPTVRGFIETGLKDFGPETCSLPVRAMPSASYLACTPEHAKAWPGPVMRYWNPPDHTLTPDELPFAEAVEGVRSTLIDAVALRLRAAVPVAFELSGGVDSPSVVAAAIAGGAKPVAYTLTYPGADEEPLARIVARRFRLDYHVLRSQEDELIADARAFAERMEEPYHAPNVFTHFKMREQMKAEGIDVVLCGSGGDEVFAGYDTDFWPAARQALKAQGYRRDALVGEAVFRFLTWPRTRETIWLALKWTKRSLARRLVGRRGGPPTREAPRDYVSLPARQLQESYSDLSFFEQRLFHFEVAFLPHYLATDDRLTMSLPLEQRNPFLDHRLVELGLSLPPSYLFRNGWTKYVLRKAMDPFVPARVLWRRRKAGFPVRLDRFLRKARAELEPLVAEVAGRGLIDTDRVDYNALLHANPGRLWRICSTGLWLRSAVAPGPGRRDQGIQFQ